eukprot:gene7692-12158_t
MNIEETIENTQDSKKTIHQTKRFTQHEIRILNKVYTQNPFPSSETKQQLANFLKQDKKSIQIWFQNQRSRMKKLENSKPFQELQFKQSLDKPKGGKFPKENSIKLISQNKLNEEIKGEFDEELRIHTFNFFNCSKCSIGNSQMEDNFINIFIDGNKKQFNVEFSNFKRIEFDYFDISKLTSNFQKEKGVYSIVFQLFRFPKYSVQIIENKWKNILPVLFANQNFVESKIIEVEMTKAQYISRL